MNRFVEIAKNPLVISGAAILALLVGAQLGPDSLRRLPLALVLHAMVITAAAFRWGQNPQLKTVTPTGIVNTDLLLNAAAIAGAFIAVAALAFLLIRPSGLFGQKLVERA